jgi:hypothetical protein
MAGESINVPLPAEFLESFGLTGAALKRAKEDSKELLKNIREAEKSGKALSPEIIERRVRVEETTERLKGKVLIEEAEKASRKGIASGLAQAGSFASKIGTINSWGDLAAALPLGGGAYLAEGRISGYLAKRASRYTADAAIETSKKLEAILRADDISLAERVAGRSSSLSMSAEERTEWLAAKKAAVNASKAVRWSTEMAGMAKLAGTATTIVASWPVALASTLSSVITMAYSYQMNTAAKSNLALARTMGELYSKLSADQYGTKYEATSGSRSVAEMKLAANQAGATNWYSPVEAFTALGLDPVGPLGYIISGFSERAQSERRSNAMAQDVRYREWARTQSTRTADNLSMWKLQGDFHTPGSVLANQWNREHSYYTGGFFSTIRGYLIPASDLEINQAAMAYQAKAMTDIDAAKTARTEFSRNPRYRAEETLRAMRITALEHDQYRTTLQWNKI